MQQQQVRTVADIQEVNLLDAVVAESQRQAWHERRRQVQEEARLWDQMLARSPLHIVERAKAYLLWMEPRRYQLCCDHWSSIGDDATSAAVAILSTRF